MNSAGRVWMVRYSWSVVVPAGALAYSASWFLAAYLVPNPHQPPADAALFLGGLETVLKPEPREQLEFVLALLFVGAALFTTAVLGWAFRPTVETAPCRAGQIWRVLVQMAVLGVVIWCIGRYVGRDREEWFLTREPVLQTKELGRFALAVAGVALVLGSGLIGVLAKLPSHLTSRAWKVLGISTAWLLAAACAIAVVLPGLYLEKGVEPASSITGHMPYQLGEFAAVCTGHTPDVDFCPQYQHVMAYFFVPLFRCYSLTPAHFTVVMAVLNFLELLAFYWLLMRAARSCWAALALFVLMAATGAVPFFMELHNGFNQAITPFNYYAVHPLRTFYPCMTGVAIAWHLSNPTRRIPLAVAGFVGLLTAVNNLDFGLPAFVAAAAAVILSEEMTFRGVGQAFMRRLPWFLLGSSIGVTLWLGLVLGRTGELPHVREMLEFQRIFAANGFYMLPAPRIGLHHAVLLTFMAALLQGMLRDREDRLLNGLLIFASISGLGALAYYVGRSHPNVLRCAGLAWGFALGLSTIATYKDVTATSKSWAWMTRPALLALVIGLGYATLQVFSLTAPDRELARLRQPRGERWPKLGDEIELVKQHQQPGDQVMIYYPYAHLIALYAHVKNVNPYTDMASILIRIQLQRMVEACDRYHVNRVYGHYTAYPEMYELMTKAGFKIVGGKPPEDPTTQPAFYIWERPGCAERLEARK